MTGCNFCLDNNQLKGKILLRGDLAYAVESIDSVLQHAAMIIPYRHVATPFELTEAEWLETRKLLTQVKSILDKHNPSGYTLGWNVGEDAGQNVPHVHLHVISRFSDEPLAGKGLRYAFKQESNRRPGK